MIDDQFIREWCDKWIEAMGAEVEIDIDLAGGTVLIREPNNEALPMPDRPSFMSIINNERDAWRKVFRARVTDWMGEQAKALTEKESTDVQP
jgi:hypothetical protein